MSVVVTGTLGLCLWIVLWTLGVSGLDSILIAVLMVAIATALSNVANLSSRKDR